MGEKITCDRERGGEGQEQHGAAQLHLAWTCANNATDGSGALWVEQGALAFNAKKAHGFRGKLANGGGRDGKSLPTSAVGFLHGNSSSGSAARRGLCSSYYACVSPFHTIRLLADRFLSAEASRLVIMARLLGVSGSRRGKGAVQWPAQRPRHGRRWRRRNTCLGLLSPWRVRGCCPGSTSRDHRHVFHLHHRLRFIFAYLDRVHDL